MSGPKQVRPALDGEKTNEKLFAENFNDLTNSTCRSTQMHTRSMQKNKTKATKNCYIDITV